MQNQAMQELGGPDWVDDCQASPRGELPGGRPETRERLLDVTRGRQIDVVLVSLYR
ncbi:MAG TPA: hypothetical protein VH601_23145 [Bryobacteraceae bacterium]|jgi:hypothetical protein